MEYSVLMSVYKAEQPEYLRQSLNSMFTQTVPPKDLVLVCDGPLNADLDSVVEEFAGKWQEKMQILRLKQNGGLWNALNQGMKLCRCELIARMDTDDISLPSRCEKQLEVFRAMPDVAVCSGFVEEFGSEGQGSVRRVPEKNDAILAFMKRRSPFNHPCAMFRKSAVEAVGGYENFYRLEDYHLWVRLLKAGYQGYNLQEILLKMRVDSGMYRRRGGVKYAMSQMKLCAFLHRMGVTNLPETCLNMLKRGLGALVPSFFRKFLYNTFLRR